MRPSRLPSGGARLRRLALAKGFLLFALVLSPQAWADADSLCGPFAEGRRVAARVDVREQGITTASPAAISDGGAGSIVPLPSEQQGVRDAEPRGADDPGSSEALLALPKNDAGQIPTDFELGPGARIAQSFFSPVVCATISRVTGPPGATPEQLVTEVPEGSLVVENDVYASAASELTPIAAPSEPDPYAPLQYGLAISGVREARLLSKGEGVTIALLDSAPEAAHRDLSETRIRSLGESDEPPEIGVHGTLVAGVIAAIEGNGFGIAGLAPEAELVPIPACTPSGSAGGRCTIFRLVQGLDRAWEAESMIVNLSLSGPDNPLLERGVARLEALGVVVVAAAGNEGTSERRYPAAYPSVIGVGAHDREGQPFVAGNRGSWVELYAPGVEVLSTIPGDAFAFGNGTSLAAAHVTGSLAILTSVTRDPKRARGELFRTLRSTGAPGLPMLPRVCEVLGRLAIDCRPGEAASAARP